MIAQYNKKARIEFKDFNARVIYFGDKMRSMVRHAGIFAIFAIIAGTLAMRGNGKKVQPKQMITAIALLGMTMSAPLLLASIFLLIIP